MSSMLEYYGRRAGEYERVYEKPERQWDLARLETLVTAATAGGHVLEVACGTGYWTERYAATAGSVVGVDASEDVLAAAARKPYPPGRVRLAKGDAYALDGCAEVESAAPFTAAVVAFWWSHVPTARLPTFLNSLHRCLSPSATVWVCDNRYVEGSSTPLSHSDDAGNTYQTRRLADGSEHAVLKNFPTESKLRAAVANSASRIHVRLLEYFWVMRYELAPGG